MQHYELSSLLVASEVMGLRGEPTTAGFLSQ